MVLVLVVELEGFGDVDALVVDFEGDLVEEEPLGGGEQDAELVLVEGVVDEGVY